MFVRAVPLSRWRISKLKKALTIRENSRIKKFFVGGTLKFPNFPTFLLETRDNFLRKNCLSFFGFQISLEIRHSHQPRGVIPARWAAGSWFDVYCSCSTSTIVLSPLASMPHVRTQSVAALLLETYLVVDCSEKLYSSEFAPEKPGVLLSTRCLK